MKVRELMEKRAGLVSQARALLDKADEEKRELSAEEQGQWDGLQVEIQKLTASIQRGQVQDANESEMSLPAGSAVRPTPEAGRQAVEAFEFRARSLRELPKTLPEWADEPEWRVLLGLSTKERRGAFSRYLRYGRQNSAEARALAVEPDTAGGYLVAPMQFVDGIIAAMDNAVFMRQWATVYAVPNAESLGAVSLETDPADPTWTSEVLIGSEDSSMALGRREMTPHPLAKYIKVSRTLLRKAPSVDNLVQSRLGYKFGVVAENVFLNGNGVGQPLGVFVASAQGITTARDYSTGNTTTEIRVDGLIGAKYTLKQQYRRRARWLFHRDAVSQIMKLKDGSGAYLWQPSVVAEQPDRMLNIPTFESEYVPNTFTTGLYVGILGDFSFYWIADALNLEIQRLVELYAATNQVGFIGRLETDGMPVLAEAFVRVKLG